MLYQFFTKGGPLMWPLLLCSIVALTIIIERSLFWLRSKASSPDAVALKRVIGAASDATLAARTAWESAAQIELERSRRGLSALETIVALAPLLGILGTVLGIIESFELLHGQGIQDPRAIIGGVAQALITTASGLVVAIITLVFHNLFVVQTDKLCRRLEREGERFVSERLIQEDMVDAA